LNVYAGCDTVSVWYWDEDNDIIPINSQDELLEAFKVRDYDVLMEHVYAFGIFVTVIKDNHDYS